MDAAEYILQIDTVFGLRSGAAHPLHSADPTG
jgi:hypothetical protein